tara:strand:+ start:342 stop:833 length:492 start_codon:yes stop_codon:yes gene_type:complete
MIAELYINRQTGEIELINGKKTIVDLCDYDELSGYKWYEIERKHTSHVARWDGKKHIYMHRQIMNPKDDELIDHVNHNGLDNRRSNLRVCTRKENSRNCVSRIGKSKYKGVSWHKASKLWHARIMVDRKSKNLGYFKNEEDAGRAYNNAVVKFFGQFAYPNQI